MSRTSAASPGAVVVTVAEGRRMELVAGKDSQPAAFIRVDSREFAGN